MPLSILEHHDGAGAGASPGDKTDQPGGKRAHRDNMLIIAGTFGVLILTYLVYRSSSKGSASSSSSSARPPSSGTVVGSSAGGGADASYLQQIAQEIQQSLSANQQAQAQAQAGFAQYLDQLTAHLVDINQPGSPTGSTGNPPPGSTGPAPHGPQDPTDHGKRIPMVFNPQLGWGYDTGQRGVSSGPVPAPMAGGIGQGGPSAAFVDFRGQQTPDVQRFLDAVGSGQVVIQNGVVYGHT